MSATFTLDTSTSRANPTPAPVRRLTIPALRARKAEGATADPIVVLTAYTARQAQLLDPHCDMLLVGDSLGQVIYGLPSSVPVTLDMMIAHGAAVVRGSYHSVVIVDMPFGSYEASPAQAFDNASRILKETGAAGIKLEGGAAMADTIAFLSARGIPVCAHVGLTPQAINALGGYGPRGKDAAEARKILEDARAVADAGCFSMVIEGVIESLAVETTVVAPIAVVYLGWLVLDGSSSFGVEGTGHALLLVSTGLVTAVPLICFGAAAIRVPMTTLGLLQYLAPVLQFAVGVFVYAEDMPASRWAGFVLVWVALVIFTVEATTHRRRQLRLTALASAA